MGARRRSGSPLRVLLLLVVVLALPAGATAERCSETESSLFPLRGRHAITIHAGILSRITVQNDVVNGGVRSEARDAGSLAALSYAYWVTHEWNVGISACLIDAGTRASVTQGEVRSESAAVTSVLVGAAYFPAGLALSPALRPYGSLAVGPYIGSATNSRVGDTVENSTISESVLGLRVQAGADFFFSGRFKAGVVLGYHLVGDFDHQVGSHRNYSGPEFLAGFGILLGAGR